MIILKDRLKQPMAIEYMVGMELADKIIKEFDKKGVVELDFTDIIAWNTAFFNGVIFRIVSKTSYKNFIEKKFFKLTNSEEATKKTLEQSLELAELKFT